MKKILYIIPILFIFISCEIFDFFEVKELEGKFNDYKGKYIYAVHEDYELGIIVDTINTKNGEFKYNIKLNEEKTPVYILDQNSKIITILFLKEGETVNISGSSKPYKPIIEGNNSSALIGKFLNANRNILLKYDFLKGKYYERLHDSIYLKELDIVNDSIVKLATKFINNNTSSPASTFVLYNYVASPKYKSLTRKLSENLSASARTDIISSRIDNFSAFQNFDKGKVLPYSQLTTPKDSLIYSYTYKNKITILTFWDSSDSLSIKKVREIEAYYDTIQQKDKVSMHLVSLDIDKDNWKRVVRNENFKSWQSQIPDGWLNKDVSSIDLRNVPTTFLLNRNGVIIGRDLNIDSLNYLIGKTIINNDSIDLVRQNRGKKGRDNIK